MKTVAIIQARMGSTRLPGKILKKVMDKTLLEYQIERVRRSQSIDEIVIATTEQQLDNEIVELCKSLSIPYYRGSEDDVLARYYETARQFNADVIVRLTSDCPIIDPDVIDQVISHYLINDIDYVSNTLTRSYPRGMDVETFSFLGLEQAYIHAIDHADREHVTPYLYNNPSEFKLGCVTYKDDESKHRWTVDTEEDLELISRIINCLYKENSHYNLEDILDLMRRFPDWSEINAHIEQKKLEE